MSDGLSILSIEDSEADFRLIELEMKRSGLACQFLRVDTRSALLAALANQHWDLVLSDYSVPGLYFPEILGYLNQHWPSLPVMLVSGTLGDVKAAVMVKLGACDFVSKYQLAKLAPTIKRHLKNAALDPPTAQHE